jgi:hypothetical protein
MWLVVAVQFEKGAGKVCQLGHVQVGMVAGQLEALCACHDCTEFATAAACTVGKHGEHHLLA